VLKPSELVSAPRGLLKVFIIDLASKYPVSGIEIAEQVKELSKGVWTPSPGSIYYILKELVSKKRLSEIYTPDKGVKKYVTTEKGLADLNLFRSFGTEILLKQAAFMSLASHLIQDDAASKALNNYISNIRTLTKP
jgi:DNA-binding PadR family transcriptional regulator